MKRSNRDFDGTHHGKRLERATYLRARVLFCSSNWRRYFCTTLGMVMHNAAEKFCAAIFCCFSRSSSMSISASASPCAFPGG